MHRLYCVFFVVHSFTVSINTQNNSVITDGSRNNAIVLPNVNERTFPSKPAQVNGTPYFLPDYKYANIKLVQGHGRVFVNVKTRVDLATQQTYLISPNGVEVVMEAGAVKEVSFADTTEAGIIQYTLQTGFPPIEMKTGNNFYQVLSEGRCGFLKSITKKVTERKNELSGGVSKDFETYENYYLFINGEMKRWKKDKDFMLAVLADKKAQIEQFITANKTNFRNVEGITKLVNYYNSL